MVKYFHSRPRDSQIGAWVSKQSSRISARGILESKFLELKQKFQQGDVPLPSFWGGYRVSIEQMEFWQGGEHRLHDRFYTSATRTTGKSTDSRLKGKIVVLSAGAERAGALFYIPFASGEKVVYRQRCSRLYMENLMASSNLIKQLQERGLVAQVTDEEALAERLAQGPIALYCGFDPTADSLHLGHLVPLLCLKRFQEAGHKPVALVGGATGLIGDPSFKAAERKLNTEDTVQEWVDKIRKQVAPFLDFDCGDNSAIAANNYDWFGSMNVLTFLRDIGKHFSVNQMINKEAVKQRLNRDDQGISFTEFSYNLLQGYDFACLNKLHGVSLQIGGSDQWGNITSGIDLTRRLHQNQVFGLTVPLITKADGTKFGKTEGGAVWLDPKKTSPYKFYQFWINTADADVYRFLKFFTFMDIEEINALEEEDKNSGKAPRAQYVLAEQVTRLVHGEEGLVAAKRITESLFNGTLSALSEADFEQLAQDGVPMVEMEKGADLMQALVDSELQPSRGQARKTIASNVVTINGEKQSDPEYTFSESDRLYGRYTLLRRA